MIRLIATATECIQPMETTAFCLSRYFYRLESQFCTLFYASSLISCSSCKTQASACVVVLLKQYHSIWILHVWGTLLPVTEHNIYRYTLIHEGNAGRGSILWSVVARATLTAKPAHLHVASSPGSLEPGDEANLHVHTASTCNVECGVLYCGPRLPVLRKMSG